VTIIGKISAIQDAIVFNWFTM